MSARVNVGFSGTQLVNWAFLNYTTVGGFALNGGSSSAIVSIPELSDMVYVALVPLVIVGLKWRGPTHEKEKKGDGKGAGGGGRRDREAVRRPHRHGGVLPWGA